MLELQLEDILKAGNEIVFGSEHMCVYFSEQHFFIVLCFYFSVTML